MLCMTGFWKDAHSCRINRWSSVGTRNPITPQGDLVLYIKHYLIKLYQPWQPSVWLLALHYLRTHFISLIRKSLAKIPMPRIMTIISKARPRRKTSCVTDRTSPTVVAVDLFWSGICTSWYVWSSTALSQLDAEVLNWAWFWLESGGLKE